MLELSVCVVVQSSLGGAGGAEKEAGKIRAGVQRAQADRREAGEQGRAPQKSPAWRSWKLSHIAINMTNRVH